MSHLCYAELTADPSQSPLGTIGSAAFLQKISQIFSHWDTGTNAKTAAELTDDVIANLGLRLNGGLAVMVKDDNKTGGTLQILHGFSKSSTTKFYRRTFAYLGDTQGTHIDTVELDPTLLETTAETRIYSDIKSQLQHFAGNDNDLVPAHGNASEATQLVKTRKAMFVPFPLLSYLLPEELTAKKAIQILVPIIEDSGMEAVCKPLLDWLMVASTAQGEGTLLQLDQAGTTPQGARPLHVERDEDLKFRQLPALKPSTRGTDPAVMGILQASREQADAVQAMVAERRADREAEKAPKTVSDKWPDYHNSLLKLCHVYDEQVVPRL